MPWNPSALSVHQSLKGDGVLGVQPGNHWPSCSRSPDLCPRLACPPTRLSSLSSSCASCQPSAAATAHCSHHLMRARAFLPPRLCLSRQCCPSVPPVDASRAGSSVSCSGNRFPRLLTRANYSLHCTSPVPDPYREHSAPLSIYGRMCISRAVSSCRL